MAITDKVTRWHNKIQMAEKVQEHYNREYGYDRALQQYRGEYEKAMPKLLRGKDIIPINEVKAFVKTIVPSIYSRDPHIAVNPIGAKNAPSSKIQEKSVNAIWREMRVKQEIKRAIVDALLGPWGWIKFGYSAVFGSIEPKEGQPNLDANEFIRDEEIFAVRESWKRIHYDFNAINAPFDCRWMSHKIPRPLEAVKSSPIFKNTSGLKANFKGTLFEMEGKNKQGIAYEGQEDMEFVWLREIWNRDEAKVITLADDHSKKLLEKDWPKGYPSYPFAGLSFDINPDENYPQNQIQHWEPQLWEKIKLRALILDHIKRFGRQLMGAKDAMEPREMAKFIKGLPGFIGLKPNLSDKDKPQPIPYPPIQPDIYAVSNAIDRDKDNLSGMADVIRGAPQKTQSRTLGELDKLITAFQSRNVDPQEVIEDFSEQVARGIIALMKEYVTLERFVQLSQEETEDIINSFVNVQTRKPRFDGQGFWYTREDIQGDYDVKVAAGSTLPLDKKNRVGVMSQVLKFAPALGLGPGSQTSAVLGKNLMADLELDEVAQAYEDDIREMRADREAKQRMARIQGEAVRAGQPIPGGGGRAPAAPPRPLGAAPT